MAVKTSLVVETFNPNTNKNVAKTATYANPDATDVQLNNFAQKMYGSSGLSANTVNSVTRVDKKDITNAEPDIPDGARITSELFTTPYQLIASHEGWLTLDSVTLNEGTLTLNGTKTSMSQYGESVTKTYDATEDAFQFDLIYDEDLHSIYITYGEWYDVISDTTCTLTDFANLVNAKLEEAELPFVVGYYDSIKSFVVSSDTVAEFEVADSSNVIPVNWDTVDYSS